MNILVFSNFSKRKNSTKTPLDSSGTVVDVALKESTSIEAPVFRLTSNDFTINYVKAFGAYYFVNDIVSIDKAHIEIYCEKDVLATYKTEIGSYNAFILRASSDYDLEVYDPLISQQVAPVELYLDSSYDELVAPLPGSGTDSAGVYIVRVAGRNGINTFAMTKALLNSIMDFAFTDSNFQDIIDDLVVTELFNPFHYILDVRFLPLTSAARTEILLRATQKRVWLGWYDTRVDSYCIDPGEISIGPVYYDTVDITPGRFFNDFRDYDARWVKAYLFIPGIGQVEISPQHLRYPMRIEWAVDLMSGHIIAKLLTNTQEGQSTIATYQGSIGCPYQIGQVTGDLGQIVQTAALTAAGLATGGAAGLTAAGMTAMSNAPGFLQPDTNIMGNMADMMTYRVYPNVVLSRHIMHAKVIPTSTHGRPLYEYRTISSLSGYVQCDNATVPIAGESRDKDAVNGYLNGGFYYE